VVATHIYRSNPSNSNPAYVQNPTSCCRRFFLLPRWGGCRVLCLAEGQPVIFVQDCLLVIRSSPSYVKAIPLSAAWGPDGWEFFFTTPLLINYYYCCYYYRCLPDTDFDLVIPMRNTSLTRTWDYRTTWHYFCWTLIWLRSTIYFWKTLIFAVLQFCFSEKGWPHWTLNAIRRRRVLDVGPTSNRWKYYI